MTLREAPATWRKIANNQIKAIKEGLAEKLKKANPEEHAAIREAEKKRVRNIRIRVADNIIDVKMKIWALRNKIVSFKYDIARLQGKTPIGKWPAKPVKPAILQSKD